MKKIRYVFLVGIFMAIPVLTYGQSDLFEIRTPNTLIIFDTSSSMNMNVNGVAVGAGSAKGVDDITRTYEGGGNHPNSKLFIAKQALREVIKNLENVNLGFATYGQRKQEKWRGYFRTCKAAIPEKKWCEKRYWRWRAITGAVDGKPTSPYLSTDFSSNSFVDKWGNKHTGITTDTGYEFKRTVSGYYYDKANSLIPPHNNLKKKDVEITYQVERKFNAEYGWYEYRYYSKPFDYDWYEETTKSKDPCASCGGDKVDDPFPITWADGANPPWQTYFKNDSRGAAYQDEYDKPYGDDPGKKNWWDCKEKSQTSKDYCWGYDYSWRTYNGTQGSACANQGAYEYLGPCYEVSEYYYPIGPSAPAVPLDTNHPHTWSYFRISGNIWPESIQPTEYYPATTGVPEIDNNNFFFINFPEIDDSLNSYQAREKIKALLDLSPVQSVETLRYHTKLPLKAGSITSNTLESLYTPLADTLTLAKKYFSSYILTYEGGDAPTKANCRGNYIILLTDGLESARFKGADPDYDAAATAARELWELVKDKGGNNAGVKTYVIGFGKGLGDKPEVLNDIANKGGTTKAYFTDNLAGLTDAFKEIFEAIKDNYSRSNPVVARDRKSIYRGYLSFPGWNGHLLKYEVDKIDDTKNIFKYEDRTWDAGQLMNTNGRGAVSTWTETKFEPSEINFVTTSAGTLRSDLNHDPEIDINGDGQTNGNADAETIINFILDSGYDGGKYKGARSGSWKLGDIYHSTPVVVGAPSMNIADDLFPKKYSKYKEDNKDRATMVYVGANDGMLHGIGEDGKEKFAIIPKNLLGTLRDLRADHRFYVDSSPRAFDVYFGKGKDEWKTVIVSGERGGGNYYFAVDVTNPDSPNILWEQTDSKMGYTWSRPEIGRVKIGGKEKFVAFVGGGYSDPAVGDAGKAFYVIDIEEEDGGKRILRRFDVGDNPLLNKVTAGATAFDGNFDGRIDAVYFGDIKGTLWKIKIDGQEDVSKWQLVKLFESDGNLPVYYPPAVTKNNQGKVLVYFGQGDEMNLFEKTNTNYFYEIWDKGTEGVKVWGEKLRAGEKVLAAPLIDNNTVYFTTWEYTGIEGECGKGLGRLYGLTTTREGKQGGQAGLTILDTGTNTWRSPVESVDLGKGIPSAPIVVTMGKRQWIAYSSSIQSDEVKLIGPVPGGGRAKLKSWREVF